MDIAGAERRTEAERWAKRWNIDAPWVIAWAVFALLAWDISRSCTDTDCRFGCSRVRDGDDALALGWVLSDEALLTFGEPPLIISVLAQMQRKQPVPGAEVESLPPSQSKDWSNWFPIHKRRVVGPLVGPHPVVETRDEFLTRAGEAWDKAVDVVKAEDIELASPRKLRLHSEWLVRYQVLGETAPVIVADAEDIDTSTVYKAVQSLADVIELSVRGRDQLK